MKPLKEKLVDFGLGILSVVVTGGGAWVHGKLTDHDRDLALLKYRVFGVTGAATAPDPSLLVPERVRGSRARLADPTIFSFLKPKESPDEKPGQ